MAKSSLLRTGVLIAVVFILVWALTLGYWRAAYRIPSVGDVALFLVGVPLALVLGYFGLRRGIDGIKRGSEGRAAAVNAPAVDGGATPAGDPALDFCLEVLDCGLRLPAGDSTDELIAAAQQGRRASLYPPLRDAQGIPILAATVATLAEADLEDAFEPPLDGPAWQPEQRRALWLAAAATADLLDRLDPSILPPNQALAGYLWLPADWPEAVRLAAQAWLGQQLAGQGWPAARLRWQTLALETAGDALEHIDQLNLRLNRQAIGEPVLLLACDSRIGEQSLADASARLRLSGSSTMDGQSPGEGASALLLRCSITGPAGGDDSAAAAEAASAPRLHRLLAQRRERSADLPGKPQLDTLTQLLRQALGFTNLAGWPDGTGVTSDADQRGSRQTELIGALGAALPQFDPDSEAVHLGVANGDCGAVLVLAAVAVAAARARASQQAQLVASVADPRLRQLLLLQPAPPSIPPASIPA